MNYRSSPNMLKGHCSLYMPIQIEEMQIKKKYKIRPTVMLI